MARALVTGASGFIGLHLVRALAAQGQEVTCLARRQANLDRLAGLPCRRLQGDVCDAASLARAVAGQDFVYHLAGLVKAAHREELFLVNCGGMANVARACAEAATPPRLLLVSSLAAMGPSRPDRPCLESDPPAPVSNYGRSKLAGEQAARKWAKAAPITIIRPPIVFGEGDPASLEMFRLIARLGIHVVPSWQTHRTSLLHAEDLAAAMLQAATRGQRIVCDPADGEAAARGCYFLAAERDVTFAELGRMMGTALGRRRTFVLPMAAVGVWTLGWSAEAIGKLYRQPLYFNLDKAREARAGSWTCSAAAAVRDLQYVVAKPLEERLRQTAEWYRANGWL